MYSQDMYSRYTDNWSENANYVKRNTLLFKLIALNTYTTFTDAVATNGTLPSLATPPPTRLEGITNVQHKQYIHLH